MRIKNGWRFAFYLLLALNLAALIALVIFVIRAPSYEGPIKGETTGSTGIQVIANNETVENIINKNIGDELSVKIDQKEVLFNTKYPLLGKDIDINVQIDPVVDKEDIVLNLVDIDIMKLPISVDYVYSFMKKYIPLEPGLSYSEDKRAIIVDSKVFTEEIDMDITINEIDYENDAWYFSIDNLFKD